VARFPKNKSEYKVGIAREARDLPGAKAVAGLIDQQGVRAQYPAFDTAASITEKLQALRTTITESQYLLCYWAKAEGKGLEKRLEQDARRRFKAKAWYLAPPLDVPGKEKLSQTSEMVLQQKTEEVDLATLEPFLTAPRWARGNARSGRELRSGSSIPLALPPTRRQRRTARIHNPSTGSTIRQKSLPAIVALHYFDEQLPRGGLAS
jgi:hypothetical protein